MGGRSEWPTRHPDLDQGVFPDEFAAGATVLVASPDTPPLYGVVIQALVQFCEPDDAALVVTTTESADTTLETCKQDCPESERPFIGIVDTTGTRPSAPALHNDVSTVYIPSPGDLERLVIALSEVSENTPTPDADRNLLIRSLTPILDAAPIDRVHTVLDRITGLRTDGGLCLLGIDYTAHDREVAETIARKTDGVLWLSNSPSNGVKAEYRPMDGSATRRLPGEPE